jgi:hypothetical protein
MYQINYSYKGKGRMIVMTENLDAWQESMPLFTDNFSVIDHSPIADLTLTETTDIERAA